MWGSSLAFETVCCKAMRVMKNKDERKCYFKCAHHSHIYTHRYASTHNMCIICYRLIVYIMLYTVKYNATMPNKICIRVPCLCMHNLCEWWNHRQLQSPVICIYVYKNMQRLPNLKWKSEFNLTIFNVPTGMTLPYWKKSKSKASISHFTSLSTHSHSAKTQNASLTIGSCKWEFLEKGGSGNPQ